MLDYLLDLDTKLFLFLNSLNNPFFDTVMWHISGTKTWFPLYLLILFLIYRKVGLKTFVIALLTLILLVTISDQTSVHLFKNVFQRLRPCHVSDIKDLVHTVNNKCGGSYGFISSHAANTFAFATFISLFFRQKAYTLFIFVWAAIVSYSRIYLGVHFVADIVCGALWGEFIGILLFKLYTLIISKIQLQKKKN